MFYHGKDLNDWIKARRVATDDCDPPEPEPPSVANEVAMLRRYAKRRDVLMRMSADLDANWRYDDMSAGGPYIVRHADDGSDRRIDLASIETNADALKIIVDVNREVWAEAKDVGQLVALLNVALGLKVQTADVLSK